MNRKRTRRLWRDEGLRRPAPCKRKRTRPPGGGELFRAERPEPRVGDRLPVRRDRGPPEVEAVEHRRRAHPRSARDARRTHVHRRRRRRGHRGARRRARRTRASAHGQRTRAHRVGVARLVPTRRHRAPTYIEPGSPWENPFIESFNGRVRDELLNIEEFGSLLEAQVARRGLARRVQHLPTPLVPRRSHPRRVRRALDQQATSAPMTTGPLNGAPSPS